MVLNGAHALESKKCRVLVIGPHQASVAKVTGLLLRSDEDSQDNDDIKIKTIIEYVPCVARFDSYPDDQGKKVRYLASIEYFGPDGKTKSPGGLLNFFDESDDENDENDTLFNGGVAGAAIIGSGIDNDQDVSNIDTFLRTISAERSILIECVKPNSEYPTMREELAAYRALTLEEKEEATRLGTLGPGKMAKFVAAFSHGIVVEALKQRKEHQATKASLTNEEKTRQQSAIENPFEASPPNAINPDKNRWSCRKCRFVLFGEEDLEDPPHVPSRHDFTQRKLTHSRRRNGSAESQCQSLFLKTSMDWMGISTMDCGNEGKLHCPKCNTKIGTWNWSGAQCSCGTWVVPAIQIPKSKVDLLQPSTSELPDGAYLSPLALLQKQEQALEKNYCGQHQEHHTVHTLHKCEASTNSSNEEPDNV